MEESKKYASFYPQYLTSRRKRSLNLTKTEREILLLLARNFSNKEICDTLHITVNTVKFHTKNIYSKQGNIIPKIKVSENVTKITNPHFKKVYRLFSNDSGKAIADLVCVYDEVIDETQPLEIFDPDFIWKRKTIQNFTAKPLMEPIFQQGHKVYHCPPLPEVKEYCKTQVGLLWDEVKRFENPHHYYVDLSQKLWNIKQRLLAGKKMENQ